VYVSEKKNTVNTIGMLHAHHACFKMHIVYYSMSLHSC